MTRKKIIFVIVEGTSDEAALGVIMNRIYSKDNVYTKVMHYDITTEKGVSPKNIVSRIGDVVKDYKNRYKLEQSDFSRIIHITDMDGAFIPDENIIEDTEQQKPFYSTREIRTANKAGIEKRNKCKRENLKKLSATKTVWNTQYGIYYMSCNLDHVLYNKLNSSNDEKEDDSLEFAKSYRENIPSFLRFIGGSDFSVTGNYKDSWNYIRQDLHSLERHTNLGICFSQEIDAEQLSPNFEKKRDFVEKSGAMM